MPAKKSMGLPGWKALVLQTLVLPWAAALFVGHASASETVAPTRGFAVNAYRAEQPDFTLPFHVFNGHMLIDGAVNGRTGKFLFDTGTEFPFFLNNHYLPLAADALIGRGHTGSGQEMVLYRQAAPVQTLALGRDIRLAQLPNLPHTDWDFLAQAYGMPGFLGSIGHGFNQNYVFAIDYEAQTIAFHAQDQSETVLARISDPARVLAVLAFTATGVDGKLPELQLRLGGETVTAYFDTGNQGSLELTDASRQALQSQGLLQLVHSDFSYGMQEPATHATLKGLHYGPQALHDANNLLFRTSNQNRLGLGYHFLKHYVSVWDYKRQTLTLLRP